MEMMHTNNAIEIHECGEGGSLMAEVEGRAVDLDPVLPPRRPGETRDWRTVAKIDYMSAVGAVHALVVDSVYTDPTGKETQRFDVILVQVRLSKNDVEAVDRIATSYHLPDRGIDGKQAAECAAAGAIRALRWIQNGK